MASPVKSSRTGATPKTNSPGAAKASAGKTTTAGKAAAPKAMAMPMLVTRCTRRSARHTGQKTWVMILRPVPGSVSNKVPNFRVRLPLVVR